MTHTPIGFLYFEQKICASKRVQSFTHLGFMIWLLESKDRIARGMQILVQHLCAYALYSQLFCVEKGNIQVVQNITNSYFKQINSYNEMVFFPFILDGKHEKN